MITSEVPGDVTQAHDKLTQMILTLLAALAPEGIAPSVSFDQFPVTCRQKLGTQLRVEHELLPEQVRHDLQLDRVPVRADGDFTTKTLGHAGAVGVADGQFILLMKTLGRLIGVLDGRIPVAVEDPARPEIGKETVLAFELVDGRGGIVDYTLSKSSLSADNCFTVGVIFHVFWMNLLSSSMRFRAFSF